MNQNNSIIHNTRLLTFLIFLERIKRFYVYKELWKWYITIKNILYKKLRTNVICEKSPIAYDMQWLGSNCKVLHRAVL